MSGPPRGGIASLRAFATRPRRDDLDRCGLCGEALPDAHDHLLDVERRAVLCGCLACASLLGHAPGRWRRIERRSERLPAGALDDDAWDALGLPIGLAFIVRDGRTGAARAFYPAPVGAVPSDLELGAWEALSARSPALAAIEPDVEALLVRDLQGAREAYRLSIDLCFELVGTLRSRWSGFSGGPEARAAIDAFFDRLGAIP